MAKYLLEATYTAEGMKGVLKDKASGRKAAVGKALAGVGGKIESFYFAFGERDVIVVADLPDNVSAASVAFAVCASGLVRTKTTPLLTVEETDQALQKGVAYSAPGR
jgi:uncharacterized protein with GYD domain